MMRYLNPHTLVIENAYQLINFAQAFKKNFVTSCCGQGKNVTITQGYLKEASLVTNVRCLKINKDG